MKKIVVCAIAVAVAIAGNAVAKKPVHAGPLVPGIDLAASSFSIKAKVKKGVMSVNNFTFNIVNVGDTDARNSRVEFWLSDDDVLTTGPTVDPLVIVDTPIHTQSLGKVKAGKFKKRTVGGGHLKKLGAVSGQTVFAVIDADDVLLEVDELNNILSTTLP